jgi:hypothetical protein
VKEGRKEVIVARKGQGTKEWVFDSGSVIF